MSKSREGLVSPEYYEAEIQPLDLMESLGIAKEFAAGSIIKYAARFQKKDGIKDIDKAIWYGQYLKKLLEEEGN